jgi:hypothetical protein
MSIYAFLSIAIHGKVNIEDDLGRATTKWPTLAVSAVNSPVGKRMVKKQQTAGAVAAA